MEENLIQEQMIGEKITPQTELHMDNCLASLADNIPGGAFICLDDDNMTFIITGKSFLEFFGYTGKNISGRRLNGFMDMVIQKDYKQVREAIATGCPDDGVIETEFRVKKEDGDVIWVQSKLKPGVLDDGRRIFYSILYDITKQKMEREELRLSLGRYEVIINQARDIIFEWDIATDCFQCSSNWKKHFGYDSIEKNFSKDILFSPNIHPGDMHSFRKLIDDMAEGQPYREAEIRIRDIMGDYIWCRVRATSQFSITGRPIKVVGVILTIDEEKKRQLKLLDQSRRDSLTGLLNKNAVKLHVQKWLKIMKKGGAMFIIDLDDFKAVNDTFGHLCGDAVLSEVAGKLKRQFRSDDVAGRIGGDEFLVYIPDVTKKRALELAANLQEVIRTITVKGQKEMVKCSIGIAFYPNHGRDFYDLYHHADEAVYYVKNFNKGGCAIYEETMDQPKMTRNMAGNRIGSAIESAANEASVQLTQYSFCMLYSAIDFKTAVSQIFEMIGKAYNVSRVYIFETTDDKVCCSNTFQWCKEGMHAQTDIWQNSPLSCKKDIKELTELFNDQGVLYCQNIKELPENLYRFLKEQNVCSVLYCAIMDDGDLCGFVGFDECQDNQIWTREQTDALTMIANVISIFLLKQRLKERLQVLEALTCEGCE